MRSEERMVIRKATKEDAATSAGIGWYGKNDVIIMYARTAEKRNDMKSILIYTSSQLGIGVLFFTASFTNV